MYYLDLDYRNPLASFMSTQDLARNQYVAIELPLSLVKVDTVKCVSFFDVAIFIEISFVKDLFLSLINST